LFLICSGRIAFICVIANTDNDKNDELLIFAGVENYFIIANDVAGDSNTRKLISTQFSYLLLITLNLLLQINPLYRVFDSDPRHAHNFCGINKMLYSQVSRKFVSLTLKKKYYEMLILYIRLTF
jgi:hypothetical protein